MHFYFARHGQTYGSRYKLYGQRDVLLSAQGVHDTKRLAEECLGMHIGAIACSNLARTHESACIIAGCLNLPVHVDVRLRECSLGSFESEETGIFYFAQRNPRELISPAWNYDFRPYGGESDAHVLTRWREGLEEAYRDYGGTAAILVIGDLIAMNMVLCRYGALPISTQGEYRHLRLN